MTTKKPDAVRRFHHGQPHAAIEDIEVHPTAAAADLTCWLWAAFPHPRGRLPTSKIAAALEVSPATVRRWLQLAPRDQRRTQAKTPPLNSAGMKVLQRRAILRGRGHYLWPLVDQATLDRSTKSLRMVRTGLRNAQEVGPSKRDQDLFRTSSHEVHLVHYPRAHVYAVATAVDDGTTTKIHRQGQILQTVAVGNYWEATILKEHALLEVTKHRCITPRHLIPSGRTETWLETSGPLVDLESLSFQAPS